MYQLSVVIPTRNRRDLLQAILENLRQQTLRASEVVVVDDGSTDDSASLAARLGARVIALPRRTGFARAVNTGVREARGRWVAVLNNDVELARDWLERMLEAAESQQAWFACGKLFERAAPCRLDGAYDLLCRGACAWRAGHGRQDGPLWNRMQPVLFTSFTATLLRRELFDRVGWLDEGFESYLEDVEFCLRCALAGLHGVYVPAATGLHTGSATLGAWSREIVRLIARNQIWLIARHYPDDWPRRYGRAVLVAQVLWGGLAARHGALRAYLKGKREGWRGFKRMRSSPGERGAPDRLDALLRTSEQEIRRLQASTGWDWYWRAYFRMVA